MITIGSSANLQPVRTTTGDSRSIAALTGRGGSIDELRPDLMSATDIDLGFSPFTNTLPIRRLNLSVPGRRYGSRHGPLSKDQ
ncbi:putative glycolipid-binding domain-containing protein [Arthrobacter sp. ISL-48]|uniref:putative glycolipid-binding domain-containing protein n=1 Tax=Arthrobacter sp. ISL-48 TaxID=2819110 RepID=UPI0037C0A2B6